MPTSSPSLWSRVGGLLIASVAPFVALPAVAAPPACPLACAGPCTPPTFVAGAEYRYPAGIDADAVSEFPTKQREALRAMVEQLAAISAVQPVELQHGDYVTRSVVLPVAPTRFAAVAGKLLLSRNAEIQSCAATAVETLLFPFDPWPEPRYGTSVLLVEPPASAWLQDAPALVALTTSNAPQQVRRAAMDLLLTRWQAYLEEDGERSKDPRGGTGRWESLYNRDAKAPGAAFVADLRARFDAESQLTPWRAEKPTTDWLRPVRAALMSEAKTSAEAGDLEPALATVEWLLGHLGSIDALQTRAKEAAARHDTAEQARLSAELFLQADRPRFDVVAHALALALAPQRGFDGDDDGSEDSGEDGENDDQDDADGETPPPAKPAVQAPKVPTVPEARLLAAVRGLVTHAHELGAVRAVAKVTSQELTPQTLAILETAMAQAWTERPQRARGNDGDDDSAADYEAEEDQAPLVPELAQLIVKVAGDSGQVAAADALGRAIPRPIDGNTDADPALNKRARVILEAGLKLPDPKAQARLFDAALHAVDRDPAGIIYLLRQFRQPDAQKQLGKVLVPVLQRNLRVDEAAREAISAVLTIAAMSDPDAQTDCVDALLAACAADDASLRSAALSTLSHLKRESARAKARSALQPLLAMPGHDRVADCVAGQLKASAPAKDFCDSQLHYWNPD